MPSFARNAVTADQLSALAEAALRQPEPKWLLVDHGIVDAVKSGLAAASLGWQRWPAYEGSALEGFGMSAPYLHALPPMPTADLAAALARWTAIEPTAVGLSLVAAECRPAELQATLAYLAMTTVDGDLRLHCRCADARVLTNLLPVLSPAQGLRVGRVVRSWWWLDAMGQTRHWVAPSTAPGSGTEPDNSPHLQLGAGPFQRMMDDSEPDIMFTLLMDKTSELVPEVDRGAFRGALQRILANATRYSVTRTPDRLQFVVLSLATGEDFHLNPRLEPTWRNIRERGASLTKEMAGWSDDLWTEIDHGRRPAQ